MTTTDAPRPAKGKTAAEALVTGLAVTLALVLLNAATCGSHRKVDLTETGIYSLSPASKRMVEKLPEKLTITAYFGNVPAEYADRQAYVEGLLEEYDDAGGAKVEYIRYDVDASDSQEALPRQKELEAEGVKKLYLIIGGDEGAKQVPAYFHVQFSYLDKKETWEVRSGRDLALEGMEFEFSSRIRRLTAGKKKVGVTRGFGEPERIQVLSQPGVDIGQGIRIGLADFYDVVPLDWKSSPQAVREVDVVLVNGPTQRVSEPALWELDQHVMAGKPAIFLVKGMDWKSSANQVQMMAQPDQEAPYMGTPVDDGLGELLAHWGFEVQRNVIIDGKASVTGVVPVGQPPLLTNAFFPKAQVLNPGRGGVLEGIPGIVAPYASVVKLVGPLEKDAPGFQVEPLLRTSPYAFAKSDMVIITRQTQRIAAEGSAPGPFMLGVAAAGPWPSFFAGKPAPAGAAEAVAAPKTVAPAGTRVVVIGGQALADDATFSIMRMVGDPSFVNGFVAMHNLVDWAAQEQDLVGVRTKQVLRPLEPVAKGKKLALKYGNVAGVPLAFVIFGIVVWRTREARRRRVKL
jgi:hypothetical protein